MFANRHHSDIFRFGLVFCFTLAVSACAHHYPDPDRVVLQQPKAGQALIYFLRAPHDSGLLSIEVNGRRLVKLPAATYAVLSLPSGHYRFLTTSGSLFGNGEVVEPLEVSLRENERVFYHVSGIDGKQISLLGIINPRGAGPVPLLGQESIVRNRIWKECTELDARGFITISREVKPDS